jgi:hypothetical protein
VLIQARTCERLDCLFSGIMPSGSGSTPRVARTIDGQRFNEFCVTTVGAVDPRAKGLFCIDFKEDREGVPCVTDFPIHLEICVLEKPKRARAFPRHVLVLGL